MKKVFEPATDTIKITSEDLTKTLTETSKENNKALEKLNNKLLHLINDRGIIASVSLPPLSKITNPAKTSQFILVKDYISNRVNDFLLHNSIPFTFHDNLLTFRDSGKKVDLKKIFRKLKLIKNTMYILLVYPIKK